MREEVKKEVKERIKKQGEKFRKVLEDIKKRKRRIHELEQRNEKGEEMTIIGKSERV